MPFWAVLQENQFSEGGVLQKTTPEFAVKEGAKEPPGVLQVPSWFLGRPLW